MDEKFLELYNEFMVYVNKDDEAGARKFLVDNLQKFPEDLQEKLTFVFFEEALTNEADRMKVVGDMQKEGLDVLDQIGKAKKVLEDQIKVEDLKKKLSQ